jgi:LmbE family N-acetylglucosaminyl deacetylase
MTWIYLSPHFDDVALSCGGLLWEQSRAGEAVNVWTICAGEPPRDALSPLAQAFHQRWETGENAVAIRRAEDLASCSQMGAMARHFPIPDCIYRRRRDGQFLYPSFEKVIDPRQPPEASLVRRLKRMLAEALPAESEVVCPLALGNHVDHRLTRRAAEGLGRPLWYYADYPYVLQHFEQLEQLAVQGWQAVDFPLSPEALQAWFRAIAAHASQISTFWADQAEMMAAIRQYYERYGGVRLWRKPEP